jgi:hypothetical protein
VSVKALVECMDGKLCSEKATNVLTSDIGVYTDKEIGPKPLEINLCEGHVLKQTCIKVQDYGSRLAPNQYAFIIHPMPKEFTAMHADLNIFELDMEQKELLKIAIESEEAYVQIGSRRYPTHLLSQETGLLESIMVHDIESYHDQKLKRDVIIRLVPLESGSDMFYMVIIDNLNFQNIIKLILFCCIDFAGHFKISNFSKFMQPNFT